MKKVEEKEVEEEQTEEEEVEEEGEEAKETQEAEQVAAALPGSSRILNFQRSGNLGPSQGRGTEWPRCLCTGQALCDITKE